jgi:hypothetical protein
MKSLQRRFRRVKKRNPGLSSLMQFSEAIREQNFSRQTISRWFNQLVENDDYNRSDKKSVKMHLYKLTNDVEDNKK